MRGGPQALIDFSARRSDGAVDEPLQRPMPVAKGVLVWALYFVGFVLIVAQAGVAGILSANGVTEPTWFLALYLLHELRTVGALTLAVVGLLVVVSGWLLSRGHDKPARKKFGLP